MARPIPSLHHVTATVADAQEDLDFYTRLLGLRLVKKTVNFDNHNVYHFYYGNEVGAPSTIMTTFPYKGWDVPVGTKGAGQVTTTSFSVPRGSLDFWRERLAGHGVAFTEPPARFGEPTLALNDPSGLELELVEADDDVRIPWLTGDIGDEAAIRGLHGVTLLIRAPTRSIELLTDVLGFQVLDRSGSRTRLATGDGRPGTFLDLVTSPDAAAAANGLGTVHHVALAIADDEEQLRLRAELIRLGYSVSEVRDRQYFRSIYFREPGGVLYEVATLGPGFTVDEDPAELGRALKLPPWEEPNRETIEATLPPVSQE